MPSRAHKECNINTAERIINGRHQEGVARKEEARQREGRVLRQGNLVGWSLQVEKGGAANHPLGHGGPKVDWNMR